MWNRQLHGYQAFSNQIKVIGRLGVAKENRVLFEPDILCALRDQLYVLLIESVKEGVSRIIGSSVWIMAFPLLMIVPSHELHVSLPLDRCQPGTR